MGFVIFNGVSSEDLHVVIQHPPEYSFAERDIELTHVPGRSGDVLLDNHGWKNVDATYNIAIDAREEGYTETASSLVSWLSSAAGYARLEDSYSPDYFRLATFKDPGVISNIQRQAGIIELKFECKPQRFLKIGEEPINVLVSGFKIKNPTMFYSKPNIIVHGSGSGTLNINGYPVVLHNISDGMEIDCEIQDVHYGNNNYNSKVLIDSFPQLKSDDNIIQFSGGVRSVDILPRWWTL